MAKLSDNPKEAVSVAEANFQKQVDLLDKWYNILDVFQAQKSPVRPPHAGCG